MTKVTSTGQLEKKFEPVPKPTFEESTLRLVHAFIAGLCLRYLTEGKQIGADYKTGAEMLLLNEYTDSTYDKVVRYMRDEVRLDSSFSDHQVIVAEACKLHFPPVGSPLPPGLNRHNDTSASSMMHVRIRSLIDGIVNERYNKNPTKSYTHVQVEFDMGNMNGPQKHKYPGFRVLLYCNDKSYTHHYLIQALNDRKAVLDYTNLMAGGHQSMVSIFNDEDVATEEGLRLMFEATILNGWRIKLAHP